MADLEALLTRKSLKAKVEDFSLEFKEMVTIGFTTQSLQ
jgi:hypothetical protein